MDGAAKLRVKCAIAKMSFLLACLGLILKWRRRSCREVSILNIEENWYIPGEAFADDSEFIYQILTFSIESYCNHMK